MKVEQKQKIICKGMVGPAGVEPTTFTRNSSFPSLRVSPRSRISSSQSMVSKPIAYFWSP